MKPLEQSIYKTLAYFDLLNFPLTREELFRYLWQPPRMGFEEFVAFAMPQEKDGCYFFSGREPIVAERREASKISDQKLEIARRAVKLIRSVPFLRAIFICNSVGAGMARPESDVDFFIVAEKKRVWIVRLFTNLVLRCLGLRTYGSHQANRICLSFYVDTAHLDLAPWRVADDDIHFAYWLHQMKPIYDPLQYYEKFLRANRWVEKYLPNMTNTPHGHPPARGESPNSRLDGEAAGSPNPPSQGGTRGVLVAESRLGHIWKKMWEAMWRGSYGVMVEREAKKLQLTKMKLSLQAKAKLPDHGVVLTDSIIKLHENDTRKVLREKWLEKCKNI